VVTLAVEVLLEEVAELQLLVKQELVKSVVLEEQELQHLFQVRL